MDWNKRLAFLLVSGFGSGLAPKSPGTAGTFACVCVWWVAGLLGVNHADVGTGCLIALACFALGVVSTRIYLKISAREHSTRGEDPQFVVIDEWAGMLVTLIGVRYSNFFAVFLAFALFRFFDILKPWPISAVERLPREWGIMLDDIVAGIFATVIFHVIAATFPYVLK